MFGDYETCRSIGRPATLDRRRGPETELLCPGEPTPITLSVAGVLSCLHYVSVRVCALAHLKTTCPNFAKFSIHVACGRGSVMLRRQVDNAICYVRLFPVLWMLAPTGRLVTPRSGECTRPPLRCGDVTLPAADE